MIGTALTGLFAESKVSGIMNVNGAFFSGGGRLLGRQCAAITVVVVYTAIATSIIFGIVHLVSKLLQSRMHIADDEIADEVNVRRLTCANTMHWHVHSHARSSQHDNNEYMIQLLLFFCFVLSTAWRNGA